MSRQNADKDLFPQGTISEEAMLAYLRNTLSAEEKQQFEKLLEDDPFAREALEGLQEAGNTETVSHSIAAIKRQVREHSGVHEPRVIKMHWSNYAWAAVVFGLLIGIGFLMVNYLGTPSRNLAESTTTTQDTQTDLVPGQKAGPAFEAVPAAVDSVTVNEAAEATRMPTSETGQSGTPAGGNAPGSSDLNVGFGLKKPENNVALLPPNQDGKATVPAANNPAALTVTNANKAGLTTVPSGGVAETDEGTANSMADKPMREEMTIASTSKKEEKVTRSKINDSGTAATLKEIKTTADASKTVSLEDAMNSFNAGDYKESSGRFDEVLKKDPNNADALYFGGISDYIEGKISKSEKNFDKLLKTGNRYVEGSKWYKANILIQKNKNDAAKKLLQELAGTNSSYKERAVKKLAEMDF